MTRRTNTLPLPGAASRIPGGRLPALLLAFFCLAAGLWAIPPEPPRDFVVSSYIRTWPLGSTAEDRDKGRYWNADSVHGEYLTDIIVAFATIDPKDGAGIVIRNTKATPSDVRAGGTVAAFPDLWGEVAALKKKFPQLRVNLSIGGWGADGFSDAAHDPKLRKAFVQNIVDFLKKYDLDGVDVDWEYPATADWDRLPIKTRPEDSVNYITLLKEIRAGLDGLSKKTGKTYRLSTAVPGAAWFADKVDVAAAASVADALKIMSYDYYTAWNQTTGHLANLHPNPRDRQWSSWSTDQSVRAYLNAGVPPEKLVLGIPFYGRGWKGVSAGPDSATPGLFQRARESAYPDGISRPDLEKLLKDPSYVRYWDDVAKAPYLYNGDVMITYIDEQAIREIVKYAKDMGLGGVMNWEYGHDPDAVLLRAMSEAAR